MTRRHARATAPLLIALALISACSTDERAGMPTDTPSAPAPVPEAPSPSIDTVPSDQLLWDVPGVQRALEARRIAAQVLPGEVSYPGLTDGVVIALQGAELQIFFYGDISAADQGLQQVRAAPPRAVTPALRPIPGEAFVTSNMLVITFTSDVALRTRLREVLTPKPGERNVEVQP